MRYKYIYDPKAAEEYENAYLWYRNRSEIAADKLIIEVAETISRICSNPYRYRNTYKNLRETSLKRFPFSIIYLIDEPKRLIIIISVFHHKRNPKKRYKRK
jgi:plasmid stabilization system protein ParE